MEDSRDRHDGDSGSFGSEATAARVEDWLRGLRQQRASGDTPARGPRSSGSSAGASSPADDPMEAFLKAAKRLAASPRAQEALARRLAAGSTADPSLKALARVLESLGRELSGALSSTAGEAPGSAAVLERPDVEKEKKLDDGGDGGDDDFYDDDDGDGGDDDDEEPWPSAFIGYRIGLVDSVDVGTCREGCCTAVFVDHPGVRAAVWFPTENASTLAGSLSEFLDNKSGETADLGVPPFGAGDAPPRGQVQAAIQFFTEDVHLDPADEASDKKQGGFARFVAYDQGLGHGGPPLVDALLAVHHARALRRALRRVARNAAQRD